MPPISEPEEGIQLLPSDEGFSAPILDTSSPGADSAPPPIPPKAPSSFKAAAIAVQALLRFCRMLQLNVPTPTIRLRACVHAIIATFRFRRMLELKVRTPLSRLRACVHAIVAIFRFCRMRQLKMRTPLSRLRACVYAIVATLRLRSMLLLRKARRRRLVQLHELLPIQQRYPSWNDNHLLHSVKSYAHVIVFTCKLTSKLHQKHIQCFPLNRALAIISEGLNYKLDQALNSGKCKVLLQLFSSIQNRLQIMRFVLDNLKSPLDTDARKRLSVCYYTLKGLCRLLLMSTQYIRDCTGCRQVFAKLENINTIKFLLLEVYKSYQLVAINFEGFLSTMSDPSLQDFCWHSEPSSSPGLHMGRYLQLQAEKDLSRVRAELKQNRRLYMAGLMNIWRSTLNAAEDAALRGLLLARLNYPREELGTVEFLKKGLFVEKNYIRQVRTIGHGGFGTVHEVLCFGEKYAMKTIKGICKVEDTNEAVIQARLQHPNIVKLVWYTCNFDSEDSLSLLMDLMSCSLEDFIEQQARKTRGISLSCPLVAVNIMMQIAKAMMYLHSQGILHRDLKAANVLVDETWKPDAFEEGYIHVKVGDFGISKVKKAGSQTMNTWKAGTKYWRAPEVFWQEPSSLSSREHLRDELGSSDHLPNYSFPADVYSFAMTCYEIVTGKKPFADLVKSGMQDRMLKERIVKMHERPSLPEDLHPPLKDLIEECWDGRPERRPSFETICSRLDQIKDDLLFGSSTKLQTLFL